MVHEEALRAGELVILTRNDVNGQFFLGQVGTGKLKVLGCLVLVFLDLGGAGVVATGLQLLDRADRMLVSAAALPYIERRAPVAVAADAPVLHMLKPVAEASLADALGNPVDRVIVRNQLVAHRRHLDEP